MLGWIAPGNPSPIRGIGRPSTPVGWWRGGGGAVGPFVSALRCHLFMSLPRGGFFGPGWWGLGFLGCLLWFRDGGVAAGVGGGRMRRAKSPSVSPADCHLPMAFGHREDRVGGLGCGRLLGARSRKRGGFGGRCLCRR